MDSVIYGFLLDPDGMDKKDSIEQAGQAGFIRQTEGGLSAGLIASVNKYAALFFEI